MSQTRWSRLEEVFHQAAALAPQARSAFLDSACAGDTALRDEVESLLDHDAPPGAGLQPVIRQEAEAVTASGEWLVGRRIGAYRVTGIIGEGGMGAVYRAVRDDDHYRKEVAVKLVRHGSETQAFLERFRAERQILASLDHPNIARLFDGGATADGLPYFVMELIAGVPITRYAADHSLSVEARLRLFQRVCDAVQYAHANLVIHRDLKPANILITSDGVPKLLDFGMAKVLSPDSSAPLAEPAATLRLLTPDYASPEQLAGAAMTTATDIYSLGVVLYELLVGRPPHQFQGWTAGQIESAIRTAEPGAPSRAAQLAAVPARALAGDLDRIVLMALRKEPDRRYRSVEQFSADLSRHLGGHPVAARPDTVAYRTGKFLRRNRFAVLSLAAVVMALVIGLVAALLQARRADRRFQQVRKLANAFVFDVHDRIRNLPGATEARKAIVATALDYLETLRYDANGDTSLILELAAAYEKIGDAQGLTDESNLGDTQGAVTSYTHALGILQSVKDQADRRVRQREASVQWKRGTVLQVRGLAADAGRSYARAEELIRALIQEQPRDEEALRLGRAIYADLATYAVSMRDARRVDSATAREMDIARRLLALDPSSRQNRVSLAQAQTSLAKAYLDGGRLEEAAMAHREAIALGEQLASEEPQNVAYRRDLMLSYSRLADILGARMGENLGDFPGAEQALARAARIADWLVRHDSADRGARFDLAGIKMRTGLLILRGPVQPNRALSFLAEAETMLNSLQRADPANELYRYNLLVVDYGAGQALAELRRTRDAVVRLERARREAAALAGGYYAAGARAAGTQAALVLAGLEARAHAPGASPLADSVAAALSAAPHMFAVRWNEASALADLGRVYLLMQQREPAVSYLEKSAEVWAGLSVPAAMEHRRAKELARAQADLRTARRLRSSTRSE